MRGRIVHENVVELMKQGVTQVNFVGCLTNLFKDIVVVKCSIFSPVIVLGFRLWSLLVTVRRDEVYV